MIGVRNIQKNYGTKVALNISHLDIRKGDCIGLVGNNGAGKTTLLSLMLDLIKANNGHIESKGIKVNTSDDWKNYTGSYLDERFLIPHLTAREYLDFVGSLHGLDTGKVDKFLKENSGFFEAELFVRKKYIRDLSTGNKNKVGILSTLLSAPELIILDEPFASLDPTSQAWLKNRLVRAKEGGSTMILSSHDLNHVTDVSNRVVLLENGELVKDLATDSETLSELEHYFMLDK